MTDPLSGPPPGTRAPKRTARPQRARRKTAAGQAPASQLVGKIASGLDGRPALLALVAIMSFLACLAVAAVSLVADRAQGWQRQIAEEVTIQIKPADGLDMEAAAARAIDIA